MPDPLTLVVIKEIMESPMDSGVPVPKKGQVIPIIEGFAPLIISLPGIIGKGMAELVKNRVTIEEAEEFLKTFKSSIRVQFSS